SVRFGQSISMSGCSSVIPSRHPWSHCSASLVPGGYGLASSPIPSKAAHRPASYASGSMLLTSLAALLADHHDNLPVADEPALEPSGLVRMEAAQAQRRIARLVDAYLADAVPLNAPPSLAVEPDDAGQA